MPESLPPEIIASIIGGYNPDPFAVLGPHPVAYNGQLAIAVRTFLPWAASVQVAKYDGTVHDMWRIHPDGLFEAVIPSDSGFGYTLRATDQTGNVVDLHDPYSFGPLLSDFDLHLIGEGSHYRTYEKLG